MRVILDERHGAAVVSARNDTLLNAAITFEAPGPAITRAGHADVLWEVAVRHSLTPISGSRFRTEATNCRSFTEYLGSPSLSV